MRNVSLQVAINSGFGMIHTMDHSGKHILREKTYNLCAKNTKVHKINVFFQKIICSWEVEGPRPPNYI